jgi:hypothetical protein
MKRRTFLASAGTTLLAGCLGDSGDDGTPTGTDEPPTPTSVEYVVRSGTVADAFASATVTLEAVFVEDTEDFGRCYPEIFSGPYAPTITPLRTPTGECHRSESFEIDLIEIDRQSLGQLTAPASASGHALIATNVEGRGADGDALTAIKNTGGAALLEVPERPTGTHGVELSVEAVDEDREYDYWFTWDEFLP